MRRSLRALLTKAPAVYGWCRTRWSCATLAATLQAKHGIEVSAETVRRWLHEMGWVWKRARLVAKWQDSDVLPSPLTALLIMTMRRPSVLAA